MWEQEAPVPNVRYVSAPSVPLSPTSDDMRTLSRILTLAVATVICASPARAQVVASTFGPGDAHHTGFPQWSINPGLPPDGQSIAHSFTYSGGNGFELFRVRMAVGYFLGQLRFLSGDDIAGASELESWTTPAMLGSGIATFESTGGLSLTTGTTYWLEASGRGSWKLNDQGFTGMWFTNSSGVWTENPGGESGAYDVSVRTSEVPEPAAIGLLVMGLAGIAVSPKRRRA